MEILLVLSSTVRSLLVIAIVLFSAVGRCDWKSSVTDLFESKDKNMKEVASKITVLNEENAILGLDFSPDGKHLAATPFGSATVHIWDWQSNHLERTLARVPGSSVTVTESVRYSPDGKLLAICHTRGAGIVVARIWNTGTWNIVHDIVEPESGACDAIEFSSDGKTLIRVMANSVFGFKADNLVTYDTSTWISTWGVNTEPFLPKSFSISPDNKFGVIGGAVFGGIASPRVTVQAQIAIVDMVQRKIIRTMPIQPSNIVEYHRVAWSPDGERIAYAGRYGIKIFDTHSWEQVIEEASSGKGDRIHIRYTPDGRYFIESGFGSEGDRVRIWDAQHHELMQEIKAIPGCIAVSRDGRHFAMGGDKKIIVWQLK